MAGHLYAQRVRVYSNDLMTQVISVIVTAHRTGDMMCIRCWPHGSALVQLHLTFSLVGARNMPNISSSPAGITV
jgi:hypothetical protein